MSAHSRARLLALPLAILIAAPSQAQTPKRWLIHDFDRPTPPVVTPGASPGAAPSDAIVLFDGKGLDAWSSTNGGAPGWTVRDDYMETRPGAGALQTKRSFGDVQLHVEFATPSVARGSGQDRGNSGVIIMGRYEVQVLDSYENRTYADGQAAAVYGQHVPTVNASRKPGEWQTYDIVFRRPRFAADGKLQRPATVTVLHNGVLVQDHVELWGETNWLHFTKYGKHADALPLVLQDHDHPVRYRNIWLRELPEPTNTTGPLERVAKVKVPLATLQKYAGKYGGPENGADVLLERGMLALRLAGSERRLVLVPTSSGHFEMQSTAGTVDFTQKDGEPVHLMMKVAGVERELVKQR